MIQIIPWKKKSGSVVFQIFALACLWGNTVFSSELFATELQDIKTRGFLIVGVKDNFPGLGQRQSDGTIQGFEIDVARALSQRLLGNDTKIKLVPLLNRDRLSKVIQGDVDMVIANVTITEARRRVVRFSPPYLASHTAFITPDPNIQTLSQLPQVSIGVLDQSVAIGRLKAALPGANLVGLASYTQAKESLTTGSLGAFAGDLLVLRQWPESDSYRILNQGLGFSAIAIALPKGVQHESLYQSVRDALNELDQSGWLQQKRKEWGVSTQDLTGLDSLEKDLSD